MARVIESSRTGSPSISVVVPVYNSEESLPELCGRLEDVLNCITTNFELIFVNDGSRDASWQVVQELVAENSWTRGIDLMRNYGQHNALLCGIRTTRHKVIITMDDDLQHPPEEIPKLLGKLAEGYDVVYGVPNTLSHSWWRNFTSKLAKRALAYTMGIKNVRDINAFRAFKADLSQAFADYQSPNLLLDVLLTWGTTRFTTVEVNHEPRRIGKSNYNFLKLFNQTMFVLTGFSTGPLRLASFIGFAFTLIGLGILTFVVGRFLIEGGSVPGFPFLASVIAIFSGAQMFALGIIGEYLARMFNRSMERPTYVIGEIVENTVNSDRKSVDAEKV